MTRIKEKFAARYNEFQKSAHKQLAELHVSLKDKSEGYYKKYIQFIEEHNKEAREDNKDIKDGKKKEIYVARGFNDMKKIAEEGLGASSGNNKYEKKFVEDYSEKFKEFKMKVKAVGDDLKNEKEQLDKAEEIKIKAIADIKHTSNSETAKKITEKISKIDKIYEAGKTKVDTKWDDILKELDKLENFSSLPTIRNLSEKEFSKEKSVFVEKANQCLSTIQKFRANSACYYCSAHASDYIAHDTLFSISSGVCQKILIDCTDVWLFVYKMNHAFHLEKKVVKWLGKEDQLEQALHFVRYMNIVEASADELQKLKLSKNLEDFDTTKKACEKFVNSNHFNASIEGLMLPKHIEGKTIMVDPNENASFQRSDKISVDKIKDTNIHTANSNAIPYNTRHSQFKGHVSVTGKGGVGLQIFSLEPFIPIKKVFNNQKNSKNMDVHVTKPLIDAAEEKRESNPHVQADKTPQRATNVGSSSQKIKTDKGTSADISKDKNGHVNAAKESEKTEATTGTIPINGETKGSRLVTFGVQIFVCVLFFWNF